jgi:hypothetical protein
MRTIRNILVVALAVVSIIALNSCGEASTSCGSGGLFGDSGPTVKSGASCATCNLLLGENITDGAVCQRLAAAKQCTTYSLSAITGDCAGQQCKVGCPGQ